MAAVFVQKGEAVHYTPTANVAAGDVVVQGDLVGVAKTPIAANVRGTLAVVGVFDFPKATGTGSGIPAGTKTYWNVAGKLATATADGNVYLGKAIKAAADADATVRVRLSNQ